ncbi:hypothetical protein [Pseudomonas oryzihabitans]|uniref:Uncharacterized protein n=1 Tax=Pseudomonas oryzihabitans TaxID=47885 RepID=A0ABX3IVQ7_9PSED|nr:hypothetical protein [Pseudomonas psychrotolerans]ONN71687.1 hypothetical protein BVL52_08565 [Pseudomonas psychrotolerans]
MIHYHGTPIGGSRQDAARFLTGRHALVPFPRQDDIGIVAEVCQSFVFDNGAFTVWRQGGQLDVYGYVAWVEQWHRHPGFDWALIPDVIEGSEAENDQLIADWPQHLAGVPVWHLHESLERLDTLSHAWRTVAFGSSGQWSSPGTDAWWKRINAAMATICDDHGRPRCKLHGLRMLDPAIFSRLPFASADSTNAAVNGGSISRFGMYAPPTAGQRASVIADRIEAHNSAALWMPEDQLEMAI